MKNACLLVLALFSTMAARSQKFEFIGYGGYTYDERVDATGGFYTYGKISGSGMWGAAVEYMAQDNGIILDFNDQSTTFTLNPYNGAPDIKNGKMTLSYLTIGGNRYYGKGKGRLYGGASIGACFLSSSFDQLSDHYTSSGTKFAWVLRLGGKYYASQRLGVRMEAQLQSPVNGAGVGFGFGTGGAGLGVTTYGSILQFGLSIGIILRFGAK